MQTLHLLLIPLALAILVLAVLWWTGALSRRRLQRYVPVGLFSRRYVIWFPVPRKQASPVPVVLVFHAEDSSVEEMELHAALHAARAAAKFAVVYPQGYHGSWNAGGCCGDALQSAIDEVKFVRALVDDLGSLLKIDRSRIYATGFSNGAMLCYYLACNMSDEIAAIAPVGGGMSVTDCAPKRSVAIFHLHGLADDWMPFRANEAMGADLLPPGEDGIAFWRTINGLGSGLRQPVFGGHAECTTYSGGPGDAPIQVCLFPGLGHHWPGAALPAATGSPQAKPAGLSAAVDRGDVNNAILTFLAAHALPEPQLRRVTIAGAGPAPRQRRA